MGAEPGAIVMSVYGGFQKKFLSWGFFACAVRTWKFGALFPFVLVSGSHASCVWVLPVDYLLKIGFFGRFCGYSCAMHGPTVDTCSASVLGAFEQILHIFCGEMDSDLEVFSLRARAEWRRVLSRRFSSQS